MAKKASGKNNNMSNAKSNSKYNRYEKQEDKFVGKKNNVSSKEIEIECLDDLDSTRNLDVSFIDGLRKKKVVEEKTEILNADEINKANEEFRDRLNLNNRLRICSYLLLVFVVVCIFFVVFIIYHFSDFDHNKEKIVEKEIIKEIKVVDDNYVFLGDSITYLYDLEEYYFDMPVVNSGISGYTTSDIIKDLDKLVYQYNPSKVFILIGTNDLGKEVSVEKIVDNIRKIIKEIKDNRPYSKIYLQSIYPINDSDNSDIKYYADDGNRNNKFISEVNERLVEVAEEENVVYIDLYSELIDDDDDENLKLEYTVDGLHISDEGYEKITEVLNKYIDE